MASGDATIVTFSSSETAAEIKAKIETLGVASTDVVTSWTVGGQTSVCRIEL